MSSKLKVAGAGIGILIIVTGVLLYNKSRMAARATTDVLTNVPVSVITVTKTPIRERHAFVGVVAANNDVSIVSETQGRITGVFAEVGQFKREGSVLVQVDDELKKAAYATAEVNYEKAKKDLARFESLRKDSAVTDQQLEGARLAFKSAEAQYIVARREYNDTKITTPISGIVTARSVDVGTYIQRGTPVANVVDVSKMKVKISVPEVDAFRLKAGDPVEVTSDVYPEAVFRGVVHTVSAKGDDAHTYPVEVTLPNSKEHPLKAGMFSRVEFVSLNRAEAIVIPREALVGSARKAQVYVVRNAKAVLKSITLGPATGDSLTVLSGLVEGDTVVIGGQTIISDGSVVTITQQQ